MITRGPSSRVIRFILSVPFALIPVGCSEDERPTSIQYFQANHVDLRQYFRAMPTLEVRMATKSDVEEPWPGGVLPSTGLSGGLLVSGVYVSMLMPMYAGAGVGGIILAPAMVTQGIINDSDRNTVLRAMRETDVPRRLDQSLRRRLAPQFPAGADPPGRLEVLIKGYGFFNKPSTAQTVADNSFVLDLIVRAYDGDGKLFYEDAVWMEPMKRSVDAPPARMATLNAFAANNARLAREAMAEGVEVVTAIVVNHVTTAGSP